MGIDTKQIIEYWRYHADYDLKTAEALFESGRYPYCLFMCHLATEKILKALVVKATGQHAPYTHDLVRLAKLTEIILTKKQSDYLSTINEFNIEARYPEWQRVFYKKATKKYTEKHLKISKDIYLWLEKRFQQK